MNYSLNNEFDEPSNYEKATTDNAGIVNLNDEEEDIQVRLLYDKKNSNMSGSNDQKQGKTQVMYQSPQMKNRSHESQKLLSQEQIKQQVLQELLDEEEAILSQQFTETAKLNDETDMKLQLQEEIGGDDIQGGNAYSPKYEQSQDESEQSTPLVEPVKDKLPVTLDDLQAKINERKQQLQSQYQSTQQQSHPQFEKSRNTQDTLKKLDSPEQKLYSTVNHKIEQHQRLEINTEQDQLLHVSFKQAKQPIREKPIFELNSLVDLKIEKQIEHLDNESVNDSNADNELYRQYIEGNNPMNSNHLVNEEWKNILHELFYKELDQEESDLIGKSQIIDTNYLEQSFTQMPNIALLWMLKSQFKHAKQIIEFDLKLIQIRNHLLQKLKDPANECSQMQLLQLSKCYYLLSEHNESLKFLEKTITLSFQDESLNFEATMLKFVNYIEIFQDYQSQKGRDSKLMQIAYMNKVNDVLNSIKIEKLNQSQKVDLYIARFFTSYYQEQKKEMYLILDDIYESGNHTIYFLLYNFWNLRNFQVPGFQIQTINEEDIDPHGPFKIYQNLITFMIYYKKNEIHLALEVLQYLQNVMEIKNYIFNAYPVVQSIILRLYLKLGHQELAIADFAHNYIQQSHLVFYLYKFVKHQIKHQITDENLTTCLEQLIEIERNIMNIPIKLKVKIWFLIVKLSASMNRVEALMHYLKLLFRNMEYLKVYQSEFVKEHLFKLYDLQKKLKVSSVENTDNKKTEEEIEQNQRYKEFISALKVFKQAQSDQTRTKLKEKLHKLVSGQQLQYYDQDCYALVTINEIQNGQQQRFSIIENKKITKAPSLTYELNNQSKSRYSFAAHEQDMKPHGDYRQTILSNYERSKPTSKRRIATENSPENKSSILIMDYEKDSYDYQSNKTFVASPSKSQIDQDNNIGNYQSRLHEENSVCDYIEDEYDYQNMPSIMDDKVSYRQVLTVLQESEIYSLNNVVYDQKVIYKIIKTCCYVKAFEYLGLHCVKILLQQSRLTDKKKKKLLLYKAYLQYMIEKEDKQMSRWKHSLEQYLSYPYIIEKKSSIYDKIENLMIKQDLPKSLNNNNIVMEYF